MLATNYTGLRSNMKSYFDQVVEDGETLVVTRKGAGANVVVMSQDAYNNMIENLHLMGSKANREWLLESKAQLEEGHASERELL